MSSSLPTDFVLPDHGRRSLSDLLPSIGAHLGVPGCADDTIGLPSAQRFVVVLVDGLGLHLLRGALQHTEYFAEVFGDVVELTVGVPSTTATSLTCLGTGLPPGQHGMAGYSFRAPGAHHTMFALTWEGGPADPLAFQPRRTMFERAADAGVAVTTVGPTRFEVSALTAAALRGPQFVGVEEADMAGKVAATVQASRRGERSLVYLYERSLDHTGHGKGVASADWLATLERVDAMVGRLREQLDDQTVLLVTGDHGMVDVPTSRQLLVEDTPAVTKGIDLLAGEGRLRQLWTQSPTKVAARWQDWLGTKAHVVTREQAVAQGWFGPMDERVAARFGDVLVAMREDWAVMTRAQQRELSLVGQHGSLTAAEMLVPLFADHPASW